ncbi:hypothetical protein HPC38_02090 [Pasteurellaceae bacterium HPA106]|uniref:ChaN family lipoprotein n=1 Tax=Spirabiliibacterium pneumoniae TaxID=221400 RepID=UPI001AACA13B|nr:ChaN family lipoprotein [Spirabiliibacterium pneumoniae]MBE2895668.1 hypothetical protein [Spirabiliibacterium pneumoniae]
MFAQFVALLTVLLTSCAQNTPLSSTIYDRHHQPITFDAMLSTLNNTDFVLLGEVHDNAAHHDAERQLFNALREQPKGLSNAVLEMLPSAQNAQLNHVQRHIRQERIREDECTACLLDWDPKWDWTQYRTLVSAIARSQTALLGGNLTRDEINTIMQGAYPLNGQQSTTAAVKARIADIITQTHGEMDEAMLTKLVSVQQFKDRRMAQTLVDVTPKGARSLLIAGRFHTSRFFGVPVHLNDYQRRQYAVIIMTDNQAAIPVGEADFIWEIR